jgi:hypothetical protein
MSPFEKGMVKTGGRAKGVRNRLSAAFLNDLLEEWTIGGREALRIARMEDPVRFSIMVANLLPKEMQIEVGPLQELSEDKLIAYIEYTERELERRALSIESRTESQADREPVELLPPLQSSEKIP